MGKITIYFFKNTAMNIEYFRNYCLSKKNVTEAFPFDEVTLVFKVCNKMFALTGLDSDVFTVNLKCDPERAIELREKHEEIRPGFHMNKKHWNTINFDENLSEQLLKELIDHSYDLVIKGMSKKLRDNC